jgi:hypothetical protein
MGKAIAPNDTTVSVIIKKNCPIDVRENPILLLFLGDISLIDRDILLSMDMDHVNEENGFCCNTSAELRNMLARHVLLKFICFPLPVNCDIKCTITLQPLSDSCRTQTWWNVSIVRHAVSNGYYVRKHSPHANWSGLSILSMTTPWILLKVAFSLSVT